MHIDGLALMRQLVKFYDSGFNCFEVGMGYASKMGFVVPCPFCEGAVDPKYSLPGHGTSPSLFLLGHAPLGVHSAKRRHQSPERTILSHSDCFVQEEVFGLQVLLDSLHPGGSRTSWWSPPVLQGGSSWHLFCLAFAMWPNREIHCA